MQIEQNLDASDNKEPIETSQPEEPEQVQPVAQPKEPGFEGGGMRE